MNPLPDWLPPLLDLADYGGDWEAYVDAVYRRFTTDFVHNKASFRGFRVGVRYHPPFRGKGYGFWHCIQEGAIESERSPNLARCARIGWIRAIIEHHTEPEIAQWTNRRQGELCYLLWFREEYLVVLAVRGSEADRSRYYLLKTAYCTNRPHTVKRLRAERDRAG